jgi:hypothetical protein
MISEHLVKEYMVVEIMKIKIIARKTATSNQQRSFSSEES